MRLCFFGSGVESENTHIKNVDIKNVVKIFREDFDTLVFGGTCIGLMGDFADYFHKSGGKVISVVPKWLYENHGSLIDKNSKVIKCESLSERKELMVEGCDAILCYPGGLGTMDELFKYLASVAVGEKNHPCDVYLYNYDKYYSPLIMQLENAKEAGYISYDIEGKMKIFENPLQLRKLFKKNGK